MRVTLFVYVLSFSLPVFASSKIVVPKEGLCADPAKSPEVLFGQVKEAASIALSLSLQQKKKRKTLWLIYNIRPQTRGLQAGILSRKQLLGVGTHGLNHSNQFGFLAHCPQKGQVIAEVWYLRGHEPFKMALSYSDFEELAQKVLLKKEIIKL